MNDQLKALYRRLKGRRDMNRRSADLKARDGYGWTACNSAAHSYENAIDDLCATFGVTIEELERS